MKKLLVLCSALLMSGAVLGPQGGMVHRAHLGMGGGMGVNTAAAEDCMPPALVDFDARELSISPIQTWANNGSGGSGWDVVQATVNDRPALVTACQNGNNCASFVDTTDYLRAASAQSVTWSVTYICAVGDFTLGVNQAAFSWGNNVAVLTNSFLPRTVNSQIQGAAGTARVVSTTSGWQALCFDLTAPGAPSFSENGAAAVGFTTIAGAEYLDPNLFTLGRDFANTWNFLGGKMGRVVAYNDDPGLTIEDLSACLASQWGT